MKNSIAINLLAMFFVFALKMPLEADWKADTEKTIEAAKKEGQLNLYVSRYGQAPLLEEFKKEHPEIKVVSVSGTGDQIATRLVAETREQT